MKITTYNIGRFRGNYKENCSLLEVRKQNMIRFREFIKNKKLLQGKDDIILLQEVPYRHNEKKKNELFQEVFNDYKIIEPLYEVNNFQAAVALTLKDSNWVEMKKPQFIFGNCNHKPKVVELENEVTGQSIIGLHITNEQLWDCLSNTLQSHKYTYIVGDLNAHNNEHRGEKNMSPEKLKMFTDNDYTDLVPDNYVTFYSAKTTVDHIFINKDYVKKAKFDLIPINLSDHACLICEIEVNKDK